MRRNDEAFKNEVFRRYGVQKRNQRNLRLLAITPLIFCVFIAGVLLLPTILGMLEMTPVTSNPRVTATSQVDSSDPNNATISSEHYDSLSLLFEGQTVQQIDYYKGDFSPTTVHTANAEQVKSLLSMLDEIPADAFTDRCLCGAVNVPIANIYFVLRTEDGGLFRFILDKEEKCFYYEYKDPTEGARRHSHLRVSEDHWTLLNNFIQSQCETLFPLVQAPPPESYLDLNFTSAQIHACSYYDDSYKVHSSNSILSDSQTAQILAQLKKTLANRTPVPNLPHDPTKKSWSEIHLFDSNNDPYVVISIQPNGICLDVWDSTNPSISNSYCFEISPVVINEHHIWLSNVLRGNEASRFPSLEEYLNASFKYIKCYSPEDRDHAFYWTSLNSQIPIVQDTVQKLKSLSLTLVAEDIDPQCPPSDGLFIEYRLNNSINSYSLFLELDSSGRMLCRLKPLADKEAVSLYEAVYSLSPEEMAEFTDYIYATCKFDASSKS